MIDKKPEVLAPAGDRERLEAALRFGADAVYLGGKLFNMRAGTRSFTQEELAEADAEPRLDLSANKVDAAEWFRENHYYEVYPTAYDCSGQRFTIWYKLHRRCGHWFAYHSVSFDV